MIICLLIASSYYSKSAFQKEWPQLKHNIGYVDNNAQNKSFNTQESSFVLPIMPNFR